MLACAFSEPKRCVSDGPERECASTAFGAGAIRTSAAQRSSHARRAGILLAVLVIGGVIVFGAVRLVLDSVNVLLEGAPAHLDTEEVRSCLASLEGVSDVHDLHLWSLGGDAPLLTAHLVMDGTQPSDRVLRRATSRLSERFGIDHATLQLDPPDYNVIVSLGSEVESGRD